MTLRLIGDIGGTNARFALCEPGGRPDGERKLPAAEHPGLIEAALSFLDGREVDEAVLAVATPVLGDEVRFTNSSWQFSIPEAKRRLGVRKLTVINDFVAQASAIRGLEAGDIRLLHAGAGAGGNAGRPRAVLGPGTGLGVAFLLHGGPDAPVLPSEAGHSSFAPQDDLQAELLRRLRPEFGGHVSRERLLSGPGLLRIANAIGEIEGAPLDLREPPEVSERAAAGCAASRRAVGVFCSVLGATAGDMVLTLMAEGGVFLTGGLCRNLGDLLDTGALVAGFRAKGRFSDFVEGVPIHQVMRPHNGLLGAAVYRDAT